jgi:penicillin-insensitive murein endopeptidase
MRSAVGIALMVLLAGRPAGAGAPTPWSLVRTPTDGPPRSIGRYGGGCIEGAARLPLQGDGFRVVRPERGRVFAHPILVALLRALGAHVKALHLPPLPIGDLGQPRGGPAPTGHASHQTGLDVDIWFAPPAAGRQPVSMIDAARKRPSSAWTASVARVLQLAASDARVDRIFVHPILKRALCERARGDRAWLRKIRPWWGHHDHFHLRLPCPGDSPACEPQPALPEGDGCDQLEWWFKPASEEDREREHQSYSSRVGAAVELPAACSALIEPAPATAPAASGPAPVPATAPAASEPAPASTR